MYCLPPLCIETSNTLFNSSKNKIICTYLLVLYNFLYFFRAKEAIVTFGIHNMASPEKTKKTYTVKEDMFLIHEKYNSSRNRHDIAVLVLDQPAIPNGNKIHKGISPYKASKDDAPNQKGFGSPSN